MKRKCSFLLLGLLVSLCVNAQEFSVWGGGGVSGFTYDIANSTNNKQFGFQAGVGYTMYIGSKFGVNIGAEIASYRGKGRLADGDSTSYYSFPATDNHMTPTDFECRVYTEGYEEKQQAYYINVPILLQFQVPDRGTTSFFAQAGVKMGIPISNSFKVYANSLSMSGYYDAWNAVIGSPTYHGFGTVNDFNYEGKYELDLSVSLSAESGVQFLLWDIWRLYVGAYIDYGLNNIKKEKKGATLVTYDPSALPSQGDGMFTLTDDVKLLSYGMKVRVGIGERAGRPVVIKKRSTRLRRVYL